ncbi:MAG: sugar transferase [Tenericutes bacterium]|nr:sugar transferase [Mycoplasmatota bacterium]MDD7630560.1 sugar transferase [bacterium]MDY4108192.1 sugar transferase [Bacilli bacterium]
MYKYIKRLLDIIISLILIIILSPILLIMLIITKIEFSGNPIYSQYRIGKNEKPFKIYKFKTMDDNTKKTTKVSRVIRTIGLDELLQLFNVLNGTMSIVGPRPFIVGDCLPSMYNEKRHSVRPGITGLAQVNGRITLTHKEKLKYDDIYVNNVSFIMDLKIVLKTIKYVFKVIIGK